MDDKLIDVSNDNAHSTEYTSGFAPSLHQAIPVYHRILAIIQFICRTHNAAHNDARESHVYQVVNQLVAFSVYGFLEIVVPNNILP